MISIKGVGVETSLSCPECSKTLHIKVGKNGPFLACNGYPDCTFTRDYTRDEKGSVQLVDSASGEITDKFCEKCNSPIVIRHGKFGDFLACSAYPECKYTQSISPNGHGKGTGVSCPEKDCQGEIVEKQSKRGKLFYGCNRYPKCTFALWDKPVSKECPRCGAPLLIEKTTKKEGTFLTCHHRECGYKETLQH
jgi:DNA topoisomerase-1